MAVLAGVGKGEVEKKPKKGKLCKMIFNIPPSGGEKTYEKTGSKKGKGLVKVRKGRQGGGGLVLPQVGAAGRGRWEEGSEGERLIRRRRASESEAMRSRTFAYWGGSRRPSSRIKVLQEGTTLT